MSIRSRGRFSSSLPDLSHDPRRQRGVPLRIDLRRLDQAVAEDRGGGLHAESLPKARRRLVAQAVRMPVLDAVRGRGMNAVRGRESLRTVRSHEDG